MGLFDRWRAAPEAPWSPPALGSCSCEQHVEQLLDVSIPYAAAMEEEGAFTAGELVDCGALEVRVSTDDEQYLHLAHTGQRVGPFHWQLWLGDEGRALYDDDAPVQLDDCLAVQAGIERVEWVDREVFAVGAATLCPSGVQAAMVKALTNPRVRARG